MATSLFFPSAVAMPIAGHGGTGVTLHPHHQNDDDQEAPQPMVEGEEEEDVEAVEVEQVQETVHQQNHRHTEGRVEVGGTAPQRGTAPSTQVTAMELGTALAGTALTLAGRITLKPRRTLSLSPTP
ncbi:unnamed protein product, partial [Meganyctiphanes norvegica]